jgi:FtsP/CotA-like multicopper oxidase with cupredoxin domain
MDINQLKFDGYKNTLTQRRRTHRWLIAALVAFTVILIPALPARGQASPTPTPSPAPTPDPRPCPVALTTGQNLIAVPEIAAMGHKLRGTIILSDEQEWIPVRIPVSAPTDSSRSECSPQYVRTFRELGAKPNLVAAPQGTIFPGTYGVPRPGPTLRARVGDLVQLAFINQIDPGNFGDSIDRAERGRGNGCDEVGGLYPGKDTFPDCFHGSSTGNIHFHGTHTNPNTTGDNVFIEVRPSLRVKGKPIVTPQSVANSFNGFFDRCEAELKNNVLKEWPRTWSDLPNYWTAEQRRLLNLYDTQMRKDYGPGTRKLWPIDAGQLKAGAWPQYYIGAYPYCYRLPEYPAGTWPPPSPPSAMGGSGAGTAAMSDHMAADEDAMHPLMMGQSPGTHWYHAHKHGSTAINVANGMTGAFIIEGQYDEDLNTWYGTDWTRSAQVLVINQLGVSPNKMRGKASRQDKGPDFSVNGQLQPVISMLPGEVQMWRIVNTSGRAGAYFLGPPGSQAPQVAGCPTVPVTTAADFQWKQLAQDGVQFNNTNYQESVPPFLMAAGNRVDLLVKAPATPCTNAAGCIYPVMVQNEVDPQDLSSACPITLMSVNVSGTAVDPKSNGAQFIPQAPKFPAFLADIKDEEVSGTKVMFFNASGPGASNEQTIDGKKFDGEVGAVVLLNKVEEWKLMNGSYASTISHPFHIHINPFQIVDVFNPNDPLIDPATGKAPINPATGSPYIDPQTNQPAVKYTFHSDNLAPGQCYLDPNNPDTWNPVGANPQKPCNQAPPKSNLIWWDVFPIPSGYAPTLATTVNGKTTNTPVLNGKGQPVQVPGYFKMRSRFVDYPGQYVLHCHILAHEDRGMMTIVEVAPVRTPYSHE